MISAARALSVPLTAFTATPALALSKAGHQFAADSNRLYPVLKHLETADSTLVGEVEDLL